MKKLYYCLKAAGLRVGRLLCRLGLHHYTTTGAVVEGKALRICCRLDCHAHQWRKPKKPQP